MIIYDKVYFDNKIKFKNRIIKSMINNNIDKISKKKYYIIIFDFNSSESFDIVCTSHLSKISSLDELVLVGVSKTKENAIQQVTNFYQNLLDDNIDISSFDLNNYFLSNTKKE